MYMFQSMTGISLSALLQNKYFIAISYIVICFILCKLVNLVFKMLNKASGKENIGRSFLRSCIKAFLVLVTLFMLGSLSSVWSQFSTSILMSSSLLIVVTGFIFQEGLTNIIHGFIIIIFKPFEIGDRVEVSVNGESINGYVTSINLRHTVITTVADNAESIIANSLLDKSTIKNLTMQEAENRYPLTVSITYEHAQNPLKLRAAKRIISEEILKNPLTLDLREDKSEDLFVNVAFAASSVDLTCFVNTKTPEDNYKACSQIKEELLRRFKINDIDFAYNHLELSGHINTTDYIKKETE